MAPDKQGPADIFIYTIITSEEADALDAEELPFLVALDRKGKRRHFASKPCQRAQGPFRPNLVCDPNKVSSHHPLGRGRNY